MMSKSLAVVVASVTMMSFLAATPIKASAAGRSKVDCDKVMEELNAGKKPREVASDLHISRASVYRCRKRARAQAKKSETSPSSSTGASSSSGSSSSSH